MNADLDTVVLFTTDPERLAGWYRRCFELEDPQRAPGHLGFRVGSVYLGFDVVDAHPGAASSVSLWFRVDDVDTVFARLEGAGAEVIYPPQNKPWGDRLAALRDPDGNRIGLSQRHRA